MKSGQKIINIMNENWAPFTRKSCSGQTVALRVTNRSKSTTVHKKIGPVATAVRLLPNRRSDLADLVGHDAHA